MITIVEPKDHIARLWGKQKVRESDTYRLMRYVLRVDHEGKVLLHNVVTGQLVVLSEEEARVLDQLPTAYTTTMEQLVSEHYLVPEAFDEHQQVVNLRNILWRMYDAQQSKDITHYTILPTTACNARCYYCFERGCETVTMTEETANDLVDFIASHCGGKEVRLSWFGGEPTVAAHRIDQICEGLYQKGIDYTSDMTTNGYLLDSKMVERAINLWVLKRVMICVDGTEINHNKTKAFVGVDDNPYQRVMSNVGSLLDKQIQVNLRMNLDLYNYDDFRGLIDDCKDRFKDYSLLHIWVHPIIGEYADHDGIINHADEVWFEKSIFELNSIAREENVLAVEQELPSLKYSGCRANNASSLTITPQGKFVCCPEQFSNDQVIGDLKVGRVNSSIIESWKRFADYERCKDCLFFPQCLSISNCSAGDRCGFLLELTEQYNQAVKRSFLRSGQFHLEEGL